MLAGDSQKPTSAFPGNRGNTGDLRTETFTASSSTLVKEEPLDSRFSSIHGAHGVEEITTEATMAASDFVCVKTEPYNISCASFPGVDREKNDKGSKKKHSLSSKQTAGDSESRIPKKCSFARCPTVLQNDTEKILPPNKRLPTAESKDVEPAIKKRPNVFPSQLNERKWYTSDEDYSIPRMPTPPEHFQNSTGYQTRPKQNKDELQAVGHSTSSQQHNPQQLNGNDIEGTDTTPAGQQQRHYTGSDEGTVSETDLRTEILRLLHSIQQTQEQHTAQLQIILSQICSHKREPFERIDQEFLEEPFEDLLDFLDFDKGLSSNAAKIELKYWFRKFGGRNTKEKTIVILQRLIRDNVAVHFSWHGKKGNLKFSDLNCCDVLQKALCTSHMPDAPTFKDVEQVVKDWLRKAKERLAKVQK